MIIAILLLKDIVDACKSLVFIKENVERMDSVEGGLLMNFVGMLTDSR